MRFLKTLGAALIALLLIGSADYMSTVPGAQGFSLTRSVYAQTGTDPCANLFLQPISTVITVTADGLIQAGTVGSNIHICSVNLIASGTNGTETARITSGTGATCGTGTTALTGAMQLFVMSGGGTRIQFGGNDRTMMKTATSGDSLCIDVAGTAPVVAGWINYLFARP